MRVLVSLPQMLSLKILVKNHMNKTLRKMQCLEMENFLPSETKTDLDVMKNCVTFCRLKFNHDPY